MKFRNVKGQASAPTDPVQPIFDVNSIISQQMDKLQLLDIKMQLELCLLSLSTRRDIESAEMAVGLISVSDERDLLSPFEWCRVFNADVSKWDNRLPALLNIVSLSHDPIVPFMIEVLNAS